MSNLNTNYENMKKYKFETLFIKSPIILLYLFTAKFLNYTFSLHVKY